ncbi:hypothetical protein niasHT_036216 [Heterodera trifolii]|uniref:ISXO2-like transposase domain-containing protein n=1 Tax=Heterodera trifolii TaxID=157864 RepID=A0ABD2ISJ4_9BILA
MASHTVCDWSSFMRDICSRWLVEHRINLGGPERVVQIDESLMCKRKYNRGRIVPNRWVFGMYDVEQKVGVLRFVHDRTQATLFPIIRQYVRGGTIIHSDSAAMYVDNARQRSHIINIPTIPMPPYQHLWVNHTENFVDPNTGACTNAVELFWKNAKKKNKEMSGTTAELLETHLDEFQWRQMHGKKTIEAFDNIKLGTEVPTKNGQPKRLYRNGYVGPLKLEWVNNFKETFRRATTSVSYNIQLYFHMEPTSIEQFELVNGRTKEKLTLKYSEEYNDGSLYNWLLKRCPIGETAPVKFGLRHANYSGANLNNIRFELSWDRNQCIGPLSPPAEEEDDEADQSNGN